MTRKKPWDVRLSLYTWTKGLASGLYLVGGTLLLLGDLGSHHPLWRWQIPLLALFFLVLTAGLLVSELGHPERFYKVLLGRPQSWLTRGAYLLTAFGGLLGLHLLVGLLDWPGLYPLLAGLGLPLALMNAAYTAYLFRQVGSTSLWLSPLLPLSLGVQAVALGAATLLLLHPASLPAWLLPTAALAHLALVLLEIGRQGPGFVESLARGERFALRLGAGLPLLGLLAPWLKAVGALAVLAGLLAYAHFLAQAGQAKDPSLGEGWRDPDAPW